VPATASLTSWKSLIQRNRRRVNRAARARTAIDLLVRRLSVMKISANLNGSGLCQRIWPSAHSVLVQMSPINGQPAACALAREGAS